jgi:bifunctional DNA-binding transcriptional regulator/antitoxin component of YhaV-PrlF toxin-antitoxin module
LSDIILTVGKKGEIYTNDTVRKRVGIKKKGKVKARVSKGRLVIEPVPSLEELIRSPLVTISVDKAEKLSERAQKEQGVYG